MKKAAIAVALALVLATLTAGVAYAGSAYSNARADFYVYAERAPEDAGGFAIINYDKEAGKWEVTLQVHDLLSNTTYYLSVGTAGTVLGNTVITTFLTDDTGRASFHGTVDNLPSEYNIVRIYRFFLQTELTAPEADGSLKFRGTKRGQ